MIIEQVVLDNFGVYKGFQVVDLAPPSCDKPIILFGGLNGTGKTTFLDALQLALFGKLARCSNRGSLSYEKFLRRCIHRGADFSKGARIELAFRFNSEGRTHRYRVIRHWYLNGKSVKEEITAFKNDV